MLKNEYQVYWSSFQIYTTYNGITIYLILLIHATITCNTTYNTNMLLRCTACYNINCQHSFMYHPAPRHHRTNSDTSINNIAFYTFFFFLNIKTK